VTEISFCVCERIDRLYVLDLQQWIMDISWGVETNDDTRISTFALFKNKATSQALRHGRGERILRSVLS
jgi:hypothetical protein